MAQRGAEVRGVSVPCFLPALGNNNGGGRLRVAGCEALAPLRGGGLAHGRASTPRITAAMPQDTWEHMVKHRSKHDQTNTTSQSNKSLAQSSAFRPRRTMCMFCCSGLRRRRQGGESHPQGAWLGRKKQESMQQRRERGHDNNSATLSERLLCETSHVEVPRPGCLIISRSTENHAML